MGKAIAQVLKSRGVTLDWILDEGLRVTEGITPGVDAPVAYIGVAEKGYLSLELVAQGDGGHSSMPPSTTAVGRVARAVARLEADPFPAKLDGLSHSMFAQVGPYIWFATRICQPMAPRVDHPEPTDSQGIHQCDCAHNSGCHDVYGESAGQHSSQSARAGSFSPASP